MQTPETREIDGHSWTVSKFTGRESWSIFRQLTALAAGPLSDTVDKVSSRIDPDQQFNLQTILKVSGGAVGLAGDIAAKMTDAELEALSNRLLKFTQVDRRQVVFDADFQGAIPTLLKVLAFVIEVNFVSPFSAWLGPVASTALAKMAAAGADLIRQPSLETKPTP